MPLRLCVQSFLPQDSGIFIRLLINIPTDVFIGTPLREFPCNVQAYEIAEVKAMKRSSLPHITVVHLRLELLVMRIQRLLPCERHIQVLILVSRIQVSERPVEPFSLALKKTETAIDKCRKGELA